jgi:hypothetical protein
MGWDFPTAFQFRDDDIKILAALETEWSNAISHLFQLNSTF